LALQILLKEDLGIGEPNSEYEALRKLKVISKQNRIYSNFIGMGYYGTYTPYVILRNILENPGWYTAYTPYQPEISQGVLQALFEYQSIIAELTGMDVVNCSMYDWASAAAEALRMSMRVSRKSRVLIPRDLPRHRRSVIYTYLYGTGADIIEYGNNADGNIDLSSIKKVCSGECAGIYLEYPNYYGYIHSEMKELSNLIHDMGGLFIVGVDMWSLPLLNPPSEYDADIALYIEEVNNPRHYGVVDGKEVSDKVYEIKKIIEKPIHPPTNLAVVAIYIFKPLIFTALEEVSRYEGWELVDAVQYMIDKGYKVIGVKLDNAKRLDTGRPEKYYQTLTELYKEKLSFIEY